MRHFLAILLLFLFACGRAPQAPARLRVLVTIAPQAEAVRRICGPDADVTVLLPPGMSPESWSPDARAVAAIGDARLYLTIGVPCEAALVPKLRAAFPNLQIVDGRQGMELRYFTPGDREPDPHVWLSPLNLATFAANARAALQPLDPAHAAAFRQRAEEYIFELAALDGKIERQLKPLAGRTVLTYHPAYGYFLDRYGLKQLSVEEEGKEPTGAHLAAIAETARREKLAVLYAAPQTPAHPLAAFCREARCRPVIVDPLPDPVSQGLQRLADALLAP